MNETLFHILIIDDDEINNFIASKLIDKISPHGKISTCLNGQEGIDFIKNNLSTPKNLPDIIFLDINMPVMNGWDFLDAYEEIEFKISKRIDIYMLSSSVYTDDINKAKTYRSVEKFLSKPLSVDKIKGILSNITSIN